MKIHLISLCYNESKILPYFLNYYKKFVDKITIYDNESTDNSVDIINSYENTEVISYNSNDQISDLKYLDIKNNAWKCNTEYDWQIIVDIDEFVYHPNILEQLEIYKLNNVTIIPTIGYNMMLDEFPTNYNKDLIDHGKYGVQSPGYGKTCIFNPFEISNINYIPGAHLCNPEGKICIGYPIIKLLHYKYFGYDHWKQKNDLYASRIKDQRDGYADAYLKWAAEIQSETDYKNTFMYHLKERVINE